MNQIPISPNIWKLAQAILTQKQMVVLELREKRGFSWNQLAVNFNCTRANVREIHRAATKNLLDAIEGAGGIEEALAVASGATFTATDDVRNPLFTPADLDQPRPLPDATKEEAHGDSPGERDAGGRDDLQARPEAERRGRPEDHRPELEAQRSDDR